jgi:hypothetical protein
MTKRIKTQRRRRRRCNHSERRRRSKQTPRRCPPTPWKKGGGENDQTSGTIDPDVKSGLSWTLQQHADFMKRMYGNHPEAEEHIKQHMAKETTEFNKHYE